MGFESNLSFAFSSLKSRDSLLWALAYFLLHAVVFVGLVVLLLALFTPIYPALLGAYQEAVKTGDLSENQVQLLVTQGGEYIAQHPMSLVVFGIAVLFLLLVAFLVSTWIELHLISRAMESRAPGGGLKPVSFALVGDSILGGVVAFLRSTVWPFPGRFRLVVWASWATMIVSLAGLLVAALNQVGIAVLFFLLWVTAFCVWCVCLIYAQIRFLFFRIFLLQPGVSYGVALEKSWVFSKKKFADIFWNWVVFVLVVIVASFFASTVVFAGTGLLEIAGATDLVLLIDQLYKLMESSLIVLLSAYFLVGLKFNLESPTPSNA